MLQGGQILAARYVLLRKLGEGRATQVWQARDREAGADRVLKILVSADAGERERFLAGVRLQQRLAHPNLQACAAVSDGEPPFAVFDGVASGDLTALRGRPWPQLLGALAGIADGLAELHARGLVHRDLKPANVLLGEDGVPVLADFGLAAATGDAAALRGGSPFAMSPQQLDGQPPAPADDVYAFGALAYELLGGYPPFYPDARHERIRTESPAPLPTRASVPAGLEQLVLRCLAKEPRDRPLDAAQLAVSLRALGAALPDASRPATPAAVQLRPPPPVEPGIEPVWHRAAPAGPSPEQLRSQGFRRGLVAASLGFLLLVAGFVFFVLPQRVERAAQSTPAAATPALPPQPAAPSPVTPDLQKLAEAKRAFEELRPSVGQRLDALEQRAAGQWGGEVFARGKRGLAEADAAFGRREHVVALATLRTAAEDFAATEREAATHTRTALAAGSAALDRGDAAAARTAFERALAIEPGNALARRGLERAGTLNEVRQLLAEAAQLEEQGQAAAAAATYRKALQLDRDAQAARQALARLDAQAAGGAFAAAMSQGLARPRATRFRSRAVSVRACRPVASRRAGSGRGTRTGGARARGPVHRRAPRSRATGGADRALGRSAGRVPQGARRRSQPAGRAAGRGARRAACDARRRAGSRHRAAGAAVFT